MSKLMSSVTRVMIVAFGLSVGVAGVVAPAFAQSDAMKGDAMKKDEMMTKKDMKKEGMKGGQMGKGDRMKNDSMKEGAGKSHDAMKSGDAMMEKK